MQGYVSISELSKIKQITTETLRHYDRIGLFCPDFVDPKSKYRYYSYSQCEKIGTILELRNLGMTISGIKDFMDNRNIKRSYQLLKAKEKELEKEITEKTRIKKIIREKLDYIDILTESDEDECPQLYMLGKQEVVTIGKYESDKNSYLFDVMNLEQYLEEIAPIFASNLVGSIIKKESFLDDERKVFSRMAYLPTEKCRKNVKSIYEIPSGQYLCGKGRGYFRYDCHAMNVIIRWLWEHNYEICGDLIELSNVDISMTNNVEEMSFVYQVPVQKI